MNKKPIKSITLKSYNNHDIIFYPSDLIALLAFSWAQSGGASRMMGTRCGRHLQPGVRPSLNCLDTNPGSFHLALINQLGLSRRPLIADISAGPEVWNKVIVVYEHSYFRPGARNLTQNIAQAIIKTDSYPHDPYKKYRSKDASYIVGISTEVTYMKEVPLHQRLRAESSEDFEKVRYWYDLELDSTGKIIGGEWHSQVHPDFLWVIADHYRPRTIYDFAINGRLQSYSGNSPLSPLIRSEALKAANDGDLLYDLIESLVEISQ
jgi:hypothetical protein